MLFVLVAMADRPRSCRADLNARKSGLYFRGREEEEDEKTEEEEEEEEERERK